MFTQLYSTQLFQIINVYKEKCSSICYHSYVALLNGFFTIYMEAWFLKGGKGERDRAGMEVWDHICLALAKVELF